MAGAGGIPSFGSLCRGPDSRVCELRAVPERRTGLLESARWERSMLRSSRLSLFTEVAWPVWGGSHHENFDRLAACLAHVFAAFCMVGVTHAQWVQANGPYGGDVHTLVTKGTDICAGTSGGVFLSVNRGACWVCVRKGLPSGPKSYLTVMGSNLCAGTSSDVSQSADDGTTWTSFSSGLASGV